MPTQICCVGARAAALQKFAVIDFRTKFDVTRHMRHTAKLDYASAIETRDQPHRRCNRLCKHIDELLTARCRRMGVETVTQLVD